MAAKIEAEGHAAAAAQKAIRVTALLKAKRIAVEKKAQKEATAAHQSVRRFLELGALNTPAK